MASSSQANSALSTPRPLLPLLKELPPALRGLTFPELFFNPPGQPQRELSSVERLALEELPNLQEIYLNDSRSALPRRCFALLKGEEILFFVVTPDRLFTLGSQAASMGDHSLFVSCDRPLLEQLFPAPLWEKIAALNPAKELLIAESSLFEPFPSSISLLKDQLVTPPHTLGIADFDIAKRDSIGRTPLHIALLHGDVLTARALLKLGADPFLVDSDLRTALHLAIHPKSTFELVELILNETPIERRRELLHMADIDGKIALHLSVWQRDERIVDLLIRAGSEVSTVSKYGYTPLHWAAKHKLTSSARLLLEAGAQRALLNSNQESPLNLALRSGADEISRLLIASSKGREVGLAPFGRFDEDDSDSEDEFPMRQYGDPISRILTLERESIEHLEEREDYPLAALTLTKVFSIASEELVDSSYRELLQLHLERISLRFLSRRLGMTPPSSYVSQTERYRRRLEAIRSSASKAIEYGEPVQAVESLIAQGYKKILKSLFLESLTLLGPSPSKYALIALDSLSREELSLSKKVRIAILVDKASGLAFFQNLTQLLEIKIAALAPFSAEIVVVASPKQAVLFLSTPQASSLLMGRERLLFDFKKRLACLPYKEQALSNLRELLLRDRIEGEAYSWLDLALRALLLYFNKSHLTSRKGIKELPLTDQSKSALGRALDFASFCAMRAQQSENEGGGAIQLFLADLYEMVSRFVERPRSSRLRSAQLTFKQEVDDSIIHSFNFASSAQSSSSCSTWLIEGEGGIASRPSEGDLDRSFEDSFLRGAVNEQILNLVKLSSFYLERRDYWRAALILNSAYAIAKDPSTPPQRRELLLNRLGEVEQLFIQDRFRRRVKYQNRISYYRNRLEKIRAKVARSLENREPIDQVLRKMAQSNKALLCEIFNECVEIIGRKPPTQFAMVGLGSMSRDEMCPYSDIEFFFLIEKDREESRAYFRLISELMILKITNLGETKCPLIRPKVVDGIEIQPAKSFVPSGFSMDIGGLSPLGKEGLYELIGSPRELAGFQEEEWLREHDAEIILVNAMRTTCYLLGSEGLVAAYQEEVRKILNTALSDERRVRHSRAFELMRGFIEEFQPKLNQDKVDLRAFDIKNELYRLPQTMISALALYYDIRSATTFQQINELRERGVINLDGANQLIKTVKLVLRMRVNTHLFYKSEKEQLYHSRGTEDEMSTGLFIITPELNQEIVEVYRTLIPLHERAKLFLEGDEGAFADSSFYDEEVGSYNESLRKNFRFNDAFRSAEISVALSPNNESFRHKLAVAQQELGQARRPIELFEENLRVLRRKYGEEPHSKISNVLSKLSQAYYSLGEFQKSADYLESSLTVDRQLNRDYSLKAILKLTILSHIYTLLGKESLANESREAIFQRVEQANSGCYKIVEDMIHRASYSTLNKGLERIDALKFILSINPQSDNSHADPARAVLLQLIGTSYFELGYSREGIDYLQSSLAIFKEIYSDEAHPAIVSTTYMLGSAYLDSGDLKQSIYFCERSLSLYSRMEGNPHFLLVLLTNMSLTYCELGQVQKGLELCNNALEISRQIFGHSPCMEVAKVLEALGVCCGKKGEYRRAVAYFESSLDIHQKNYSCQFRLETVRLLANLGNCYNEFEEFRKTITCLTPFLSSCDQFSQQEPCKEKARILSVLADAYSGLRNYYRAVEYQNEALEIYRQVYTNDLHLSLARAEANLGAIYSDLKEFKKAIPHHCSALKILQKVYGDQPSSEVVTVLNNLGNAYRGAHQYSQAIEQCCASLSLAKQLHGDNPHLEVAECLDRLGKVYYELENFGEAVKLFTLCLEMRQALHCGTFHPNLAESLRNVGSAYYKLGQLQKTVEYHEDALTVYQQCYGDEPRLDLARHLIGLGFGYGELGELDRRAKCYEQALEICRRLYSDESRELIFEILPLLEKGYEALEETEQASQCVKELLAMSCSDHPRPGTSVDSSSSASSASSLEGSSTGSRRKLIEKNQVVSLVSSGPSAGIHTRKSQGLFDDSPPLDITTSLNKLGDAFISGDKLDEAIDSLERSLAVHKQLVSGDRPDSFVATVLTILGRAYRKLGKTDRAIGYLQRSLAMRRELCGESPNLDIATNLNDLGIAYKIFGENARAIDYFEQSLMMKRTLYSESSHLDIIDSLDNLGIVYYDAEKVEKSISCYKQSLSMMRELYGESPHADIAGTLLKLADGYNNLGAFEQAIECSNASLVMYRQLNGDEFDINTAINYENLGDSYKGLGQFDRAVEFYTRAAEIYGEDHPNVAQVMENLAIALSLTGEGSNQQVEQN